MNCRILSRIAIAGLLAWGSRRTAAAETPVAAERPGGRVESPAYADLLRQEFRANGPAVVLTYDLSFRLLGVTLFHIGEARVEAFSGRLAGDAPDAGESCLVDCRMAPPGNADPRAVIRDRFVLVSDTTGRKTRVFAQWSDESYRPLIGQPRRKLQFALHDFRGPEPFYCRTNLIAGTSASRLGERADRERPGEVVLEFLSLLADIQNGRRPDVDEKSSPRFFTRVDGEVRPFVVTTTRDDPPGRYPRDPLDALRATVDAAPEAKTRRGRLVAWVLPYAEVAGPANARPADASRIEPVPVVPLAVDCELAVGTLRAVLKNLAGEDGPRDTAPAR